MVPSPSLSLSLTVPRILYFFYLIQIVSEVVVHIFEPGIHTFNPFLDFVIDGVNLVIDAIDIIGNVFNLVIDAVDLSPSCC